MKTPIKAPAYAPLFPYLAAHKDARLLAENTLVIDNFAGIGGASTGIEAALGRPIDHAINHDPIAVSLHRVNHPHSHHSVEDVWEVHPLELTGGRTVSLAWFSPTCTHFSKAKGAALLDRGIRGQPWVSVRWAALVRPEVIVMENVEEIQTWGRLTKEGRPDPRYKGETWRSFVNAFRHLGYEVEWRELRACDYGTPTIRKRLFLIARRDGHPIVWPEPTHAAPSDPRVKAGLLQPYRTAAECIEWDLPCPSIFDRKKVLVRNTMNRVAQGLKRFVLTAAEPYIVTRNHNDAGVQSQSVSAPQLVTYYGPKRPDEVRGQNTLEPLRVQTTENRFGLVQTALAPYVVNKQHRNVPRPADAPLSTVTTNPSKNELAVAHLTKFNTGSVGQMLTTPITTVMAGGSPARESTGNPHGLVSGVLLKIDNQRSWSSCVYSASEPLRTLVTKGSIAMSSAYFVRHMGGGLAPEHASYSAGEPSRTVLAVGGPQALVAGHLTAYYGADGRNDQGQEVGVPLHTIPTVDRFGLTAATLMRQFGESTAADVAAPVGVITTQGQGKTGLITVRCMPALSAAQLARAQEVHDFLVEYLGEEVMAPYREGGLVVLQVRGEWYVLADIGMRMLEPRELARCQGFPEDYVLKETAEGKPISKARQVRGIGNSVCPQLAEALTRAQLDLEPPQAAD